MGIRMGSTNSSERHAFADWFAAIAEAQYKAISPDCHQTTKIALKFLCATLLSKP
ncbi:MAG: hypothetical protein R2865_04915 [Deinococcales bacterium]